MLVSTYHLDDTERARARRVWVDARPIVVGRASDCHVILDDPLVHDHHMRLSTSGDHIVVEDLGGGVVVEGHPIDGPHPVREGASIRIGDTIVKVRAQAASVVVTHPAPTPRARSSEPVLRNPPAVIPMPPTNPPRPSRPLARMRHRQEVLSDDPTEQGFLTTLRGQPGDEATRMVFADWLEQRGHTAKAELARLAEYLDTRVHQSVCTIDWRVVVVRTPIEHCDRADCPRHWDALAPTATEFARSCRGCRKSVKFCGDIQDVRAAAFDREPVVFDAGLDRVAAHQNYRIDPAVVTLDEDDDPEDDPSSYTLDTPREPPYR